MIQVKRAPHVMWRHLLINQLPANPSPRSSAATTKSNTAKSKFQPLSHKLTGPSFHLTVNNDKGIHVIAGLAHRVAKYCAREIHAQVKLLRVNIARQTWVGQQCMLDVFSLSPGALVKMRLNSCCGFQARDIVQPGHLSLTE